MHGSSFVLVFFTVNIKYLERVYIDFTKYKQGQVPKIIPNNIWPSTIMLISVMLSEAKLDLLNDILVVKEFINYLSNKNSSRVVRVRNLEDVSMTNQVAILDFIGLVQRHGYPAEEHYVTTEDGYNLVIHRIPGSPLSNSQKKKKAVFIVHGILASSDTWVMVGPGKDLAFLLADKGYDVWLGNFRGNSYSRSHVNLSIEDKDFWQFSYNELGMLDLPAMIDYILNYTGHKALHYIGHSMGTTTLMVMLSTRPEYNKKLILGTCLAPVVFWNVIPLPFKTIIPYINTLKRFFDENEVYELIPFRSTSVITTSTLCANKLINQSICVTLLFILSGIDPAQLNTTLLPELFLYFPTSISFNIIYHYYQSLLNNRFESYDYGYFGNYERYKQATPIRYDLKKITAPLALFYGLNDVITPKINVIEIVKQLSNAVLVEEIPYKYFSHADFLWAIDAKTLIYDRLIKILQNVDRIKPKFRI